MLLFLAACTTDEKDDGKTEVTETTETTDTTTGTVLPDNCDPPALGADPMSRLDAVDLREDPEFPGNQVHQTRIAINAAGTMLYGASYEGLSVVDLSAPEPDLVGYWESTARQFISVTILDDTTVATASLDGYFAIVDVADPTAPVALFEREVPALSGLAGAPGRLYVLVRDGRLLSFDTSDPTAPASDGGIDTLVTPNVVALDGDYAYVADGVLGLVVVDVSDPTAPAIVATVATAGGAMDVVVEDNVAWVAEGSAGVEAFDVSDPTNPVLRSTTEVGGPAIGIAAQAGHVVIADHAGLVALDGTDPGAPITLGDEPTEQWAMHPVFTPTGEIVLAEWDIVSRLTADWLVRAPEIDVTPGVVYCPNSVNELAVRNRGAEDLLLSGATIGGGYSVVFGRSVLAPGESTYATVSLGDGSADPGEATLCIASQDPDEPTVEVQLTTYSTESDVELCGPASDFTLTDLDGGVHTLSDEVGHPVVLMYFATW